MVCARIVEVARARHYGAAARISRAAVDGGLLLRQCVQANQTMLETIHMGSDTP